MLEKELICEFVLFGPLKHSEFGAKRGTTERVLARRLEEDLVQSSGHLTCLSSVSLVCVADPDAAPGRGAHRLPPCQEARAEGAGQLHSHHVTLKSARCLW